VIRLLRACFKGIQMFIASLWKSARSRWRLGAAKPTSPEVEKPEGGSSSQVADRRTIILFRATIVGVAAAVVGAAAAVLALKPFDNIWKGHDVANSASQANIELSEVVVRNGPMVSYLEGDRAVQTRESTPTVDLTLLNRGTARVLVVAVRVTILAYAEINVCYSQGGGDVPVTGAYALRLPAPPLPAERHIVQPLHQQIAPDAADRFQFQFAPAVYSLARVSFYALHISLDTTAPERTVQVGNVLLSVPEPPSRYGNELPEDRRFLSQAFTIPPTLETTWCYRRNLRQLRHILAVPGRRSSEVAALTQVRPASNWAELADKTPPREAARQLLNGSEKGPTLAITAAEATGDRSFIEEIRQEAARRLLARAKRYSISEAQARAALARASLDAKATPEAWRLLAGAERRIAAGP
jgi:hypothetical protein